MNFQSSCLLLLLFLITLSFAMADEPTGIVMLFRHGARGPTKSRWDKSWAKMYGEITAVGMRQQYLRGAYLSKLYPNLFSSYDTSKISIRSTDMNRTIMTVFSMLNGLYHGKGPSFADAYPLNHSTPPYPNFTDDANRHVFPNKWQPAPIHTLELKYDELLFGFSGTVCPATVALEAANAKDQALVDVYNKMNSTIEALTRAIGSNHPLTMRDLQDLYDLAIANYFEGKPIPGDIDMNSELGKNFTFLKSYYSYFIVAGTPLQRLLYSMNPLNQFRDDINSILKGSENVIRLYSAHDTTIVPILAIMGIANHECLYKVQFENQTIPGCEFPSYATAVRFEVYKNDSDINSSSIRLLVNERDFSCHTCNCTEGKCTWSAFSDLIQNYTQGKTIDYYRSECRSVTPTPTPTPNSSNSIEVETNPESGFNFGLYTALYSLGGVAGVLLIGIVVLYRKIRDYETVPEML